MNHSDTLLYYVIRRIVRHLHIECVAIKLTDDDAFSTFLS